MKIRYEANDGRLFDTKRACVEYEQEKEERAKFVSDVSHLRRSDLNGVAPPSKGVSADCYAWFEIHSLEEFRAVLKSYGRTGNTDFLSLPRYYPDLICIATASSKILGPSAFFRGVYFLHSLEDEVYDFWVKKMGYGSGDFERLISDRQFM